MNSNTRLVVTAMLTLAVGGLLIVAGLHFALAHRVSIVEDTVIGLTKDQIRNMERFDIIENALNTTLEMQKDLLNQMKQLQDKGHDPKK